MRVKVDNYYRIALPKSVLDMLEINKGDELKLEYDSINKVITLNKGVMKDIKHLIKMRLKKDISKSEENFLINLLSVSEVNNDMSNSSNGEVISVVCVLYEFLLEHGKTTKDIEREVIEMLKTSKDRKRDNK